MKGTKFTKRAHLNLVILINTHRGLSQSEENKYLWSHSKDGNVAPFLLCVHIYLFHYD